MSVKLIKKRKTRYKDMACSPVLLLILCTFFEKEKKTKSV